MGLKVTNNAFGTLNAGINSSATTIVLTAGQGARFPTLSAGDYFYATLIDTSNNLEIVKVTARSTDTMTVVRGQDNTTARAYSTNDRFELRPTAALFNEKANDADVSATYLPKAGGTLTNDLSISKNQAARTSLKVLNGSTNSAADAAWDLFTANGNWVGVARRDGGFDIIRPDANVTWRIDNSGRITSPYQPMFQAYNPFGQHITGTIEAPFNSTYVNTGGHYSTSTGRFTAPVAGRYAFHFDGLFDNISSGHHISMRKNGTQLDGSEGYSDGLSVCISKSMVWNLAAGDYISIFIDTANSRVHQRYGSFCGYLLG